MSTPILPSLVVDGREVLNGARVAAYLALGLAQDSTIRQDGVNCCSVLRRDLGNPTFVSPAADPAPWYSATAPASATFLGGWVSGEVSDAPVERPVEQRGRDGANLGLERVGSRTLTLRAVLFASTTAGLQYGMRWLSDRLAQTDECATHDVTLRFACPPDDGSDDTRAQFTLYQVTLDAPVRDTTEVPENADRISWAVVEWTMTAADGWLYTPPAECLDQRVLNPQDDAASVSLEAWLGLDAHPPRHACTVPAAIVGIMAPVVTIVAGTEDVTDVFIHDDPGSYPATSDYPWISDYPCLGTEEADCFPSPDEYPDPDVYPCIDPGENVGWPLLPVDGRAHAGIRITRIPAGQTLIVDAARRAAVLHTTDGKQQDAAYLLAPPRGAAFGWPRVDWTRAGRVVVEAKGYASDDGSALVTVATRNRQR